MDDAGRRAAELYEQHHDLEQVRGPLGHTWIETTQLYGRIRPAALKQAVDFLGDTVRKGGQRADTDRR